MYDAYEDGDKRRDGSLVCATLPKSELERYGKLRWQQTFKPEAWLNNPANRYQEIKDKDGKGTGKYDETTTNHIGTGSVDMTDESKNKILYDENCPIGFNPFAPATERRVIFSQPFTLPSTGVTDVVHTGRAISGCLTTSI